METQKNDLKCYIVRDNKSKEDYYYNKLSDWKDAYVQNGKFFNSNYKDPDTEESRSYEFYEKLTEFLNIQENLLEDQLEGKYTYKFNYTNPYGIEVREKSNDPRDKNNEIESGALFYLKSDQFGFSRPSTEKKHPYDSYLEKSSYSETSKENVAEWLYNTRSLGGSFLWPMEPDGKGGYQENPQYNSDRGGSKYSAIPNKKGVKNPYYHTYYIEDRVDLTLYEIKQVMEYIGSDHPELQGNILWNCCLPENNMVKWLRHFGNFETYVDFFKFNDFVDKNHIPYDITDNKWDEDKKEDSKQERIINEESYNITVEEYKKGKRRPRTIWTGENKGMNEEKLEKMFYYLSGKILQRSKAMKDCIDDYLNGK